MESYKTKALDPRDHQRKDVTSRGVFSLVASRTRSESCHEKRLQRFATNNVSMYEVMHYTKADLAYQHDLVERAKVDTKAFGELFDMFYDTVFRYCMRRCGNRSDAEEVVSEVFYKVLKGLARYRWTGVPLDTWLYRIAAHEVASYYRHHRHTIYADDDLCERVAPLTKSADEVLLEEEDCNQREHDYLLVMQAVRTLPERYQEVVELRFGAQKKLSEVAAIVKKPEGTVRSLLSRALTRLRKEVQRNDSQDVMSTEGKDQ